MMGVPGLNPEYFPDSALDLVDVIGLNATISLVEKRGGGRLFVPVKVKEEHWLTDCIDKDAYEKLVATYKGLEIVIPRCYVALKMKRDAEIYDASEAGETNLSLAMRYKFTERYIIIIRRREEERRGYESPQQELF